MVTRVGTATLAVLVCLISVACGAGPARSSPSLQSFSPPIGSLEAWWVSPTEGWRFAGSKGSMRVLETLDGGHQWTSRVSGLFFPTVRDSRFLDARHAVVLDQITVNGRPGVELLVTEDGVHWARRPGPSNAGNPYGCDFVSADEGWVLAQEVPGGGETLWHTMDQGRSWHALPAAGANLSLHVEGVRFHDSAHGLMFGQEYHGINPGGGVVALPFVVATVDGGQTWHRSDFGPARAVWPGSGIDSGQGYFTQDDHAVYVFRYLTASVVNGASSLPVEAALGISTDTGGSWQSPSPSLPSGSQLIVVGSASRMWALTADRFLHSDDGGANWSLASQLPDRPTGVQVVSNSVIVISTAHGRLYRSDDKGRTWHAVPAD